VKRFCWSWLSAVVLLSLFFPAGSTAEQKLRDADVIIGLGFGPARDKNGRPNPELLRRVEKAVEVYKQGFAPNIIFTGSDTGAGCEAEVMKESAIALGVPAENIFTETRAVDTITNAKYSVEIMSRHGWKSAILVSNPYHVHRGEWLFEVNPGIEIQTAAAKTPKNPFYHLATLTHEYIAWTGYFLQNSRKKAKAP